LLKGDCPDLEKFAAIVTERPCTRLTPPNHTQVSVTKL